MNTQKQVIGNQGGLAYTRSFADAPIGTGGFPMAGGGIQGASNFPVPFFSGGESLPAPSAGSGSSSFNFGQIKEFIDRMGGLEGIMNTMNKVQKIMNNFQQMAPMLKLLMGSLGKVKKTEGDDNEFAPVRRRRRRRRRHAARSKKSRYRG